jgi:hypothetical protein
MGGVEVYENTEVFMTKHSKRSTFVACIALMMSVVFGGGLWAQDKPADTKKLYNEIAGNYEFQVEGQIMVINFFEKDGKLYGAPVGETPEEILPVKGSPLKFEVFVSANGQLYQLEFVRNEKDVIDKCILRVGGMEIAGIKK